MSALTVAEIAAICNGEIEGDRDRVITGANALENARETDLSFVANREALEAAASSRAGCLLVPPSFDRAGVSSLIRVPDPRVAFARALRALYPEVQPVAGVHLTAIVSPTALVAQDAFIGAYVNIGDDTTIASGCAIGNGCVVGDRVKIGSNTVLHPNTTIYHDVRIGSRVIVHAGCVIGADGFGFTWAGDRYEKFPQIGSVEIGDDVEIGANCCIDRAALGVTRIGKGTKLDNLVHVAHNCDIGEHVVIAAQTGFSGSVTAGDRAILGGQVGIGEKARIEPRAILGGKAGVLTGKIVPAGEPMWGIPARPLREHLKGLANVAKLSEMRRELKELRKKIAMLEENRSAISH